MFLACLCKTYFNWINPFLEDEKLCHLASGRNATSEVASDLKGAKAKGLSAVHSFVEDRLDTFGNKGFHDPIPKLQLKTFPSLKEKKISKSKQTAVLKSTRELFGRLMM